MNIRNLKKAALAAAVLSLSGIAGAANIVGAQSAQDGRFYIETGRSTVPFGPHSRNKAGIGVSNAFFGAGSRVDFAGLTESSKTKRTETADTTVYELEDPIPAQGNPWYKFHRDLGVFSFVKVGNGDVWFGEWSRDGAPGFDGRQVYYVGDAAGTTMPDVDAGDAATATYATYGVNKFTGNNLLKGKLAADFRAGKLSGSIANDAMRLELKKTSINMANASFAGQAAVSGHADGNVQGRFFGDKAASLAGIAEFKDKDLNTAFGGTKN